MKIQHTFAIIAFHNSVFIESCIQSLLRQTVKSNIIICTSTPTEEIKKLSKKYRLKLYINKVKGKANDWNFALQKAQTQFVTLAHHDDSYHETFTENLLMKFSQYPDACIGFSDYVESFIVQNNKEILKSHTLNLEIKRFMSNLFFLGGNMMNNKLMKKLFVGLGDPICCPAVMYNKKNLSKFKFTNKLKINIDWDAWVQMAKTPYSFVRSKNILLAHRIHKTSGTTDAIASNERFKEDLYIFEKIWPPYIALLLVKIYSISYKGNSLQL